MGIIFKTATEPDEFEKIHRLNYKTFVEEIPQHETNPEGRLVDKFHDENTYFIALDGDELVGMICVRDKRPFSLEYKLENLESYLPAYKSICELRLLAIAKDHRSPQVFQGVMRALYDHCDLKGYDLGIMSGTVKQARLYKHLGFAPFGPLVGTGDILFQPMYLTFEAYRRLKKETRTFGEKMKYEG